MVPAVPKSRRRPVAQACGGRLRSRDSRPQHWWGLTEGATASTQDEPREKQKARRLRERNDAAAQIDGLGLGAMDVARLAGDVGEERERDEKVRQVHAQEGDSGEECGDEQSRVGAARNERRQRELAQPGEEQGGAEHLRLLEMLSGDEDVDKAGYEERRGERDARRAVPR